jgi:hypothetical protein
MIIKIILIVSLLINSALLIAVLGAFPFFLYISLLINVALVWYIGSLLTDLSEVNNDLEELFDKTTSLQNHIETIYEMEMFYGDQTLDELIQHTKEVVSDIEYYKEKYSLEQEEEEEEGEEFDDTATTDATDENEETEKE